MYHLQSVSDPLTVNVALTVRKCASLLLSIWVFGNTFTPPHWLGACLVFGGAMLYGMDLSPRSGKAKTLEGSGGGEGGGAAPTRGTRAEAALHKQQQEEMDVRYRGGGGSGAGARARVSYYESRRGGGGAGATAPVSPAPSGGAAAVAARRAGATPGRGLE